MVEKVRQALLKPTQIEFAETPLQDVKDYLVDFHGIDIQLDEASLPKVGTNKGPGHADHVQCERRAVGRRDSSDGGQFAPLKFVIRDYGTLGDNSRARARRGLSSPRSILPD